MKTKLISLALLIATLGFTGCNTATAHKTALVNLAAADVSAQRLLGGKIGTQIEAKVETTQLNASDPKSKVVTVDQRAYLNWKKATRS